MVAIRLNIRRMGPFTLKASNYSRPRFTNGVPSPPERWYIASRVVTARLLGPAAAGCPSGKTGRWWQLPSLRAYVGRRGPSGGSRVASGLAGGGVRPAAACRLVVADSACLLVMLRLPVSVVATQQLPYLQSVLVPTFPGVPGCWAGRGSCGPLCTAIVIPRAPLMILPSPSGGVHRGGRFYAGYSPTHAGPYAIVLAISVCPASAGVPRIFNPRFLYRRSARRGSGSATGP